MVIDNIEKFIYENNIKMIYLDWDGVITHSVKAIVDILNKKHNININPQDIVSWNFKEADPTLTDEEMERLFTTKEFFFELEYIDGVIDFMKRHRNNIIIVTKAKTENYLGKIHMLKRIGLDDIPIIPIPLNMSKSIINMYYHNLENYLDYSLFIDDSTNNLLESSAPFKIQFREYNDDKEREWQKDWNGYVMYKWS